MKYTIIIFIFSLLLACARKESLSPIVNEDISSRLKSDVPDGMSKNADIELYYVRGKYLVDDLVIDKSFDGPVVVDEIANTLVNLIVFASLGVDLNLDPIEIDASDVDLEVLKLAVLKDINLKLLDEPIKANLKFIRKIQIDVVKHDPEKGIVKQTILDYDRKNIEDERRSRKCLWKCLTIKPRPFNLLSFIQNDKIILKPQVSLGKAPKERVYLGGVISFVLGLNIPL